MSKKVLKVVNRDVAEAVMRKMQNVVQINDEDVVGGNICAYVMQSTSNYEVISTAVAYIYKRTGIDMPTDITRNFKQYIADQKRTALKDKQDLGLEITEGKKALSFEGYEMITKRMFLVVRKNTFLVTFSCVLTGL